MLDLSRARGRMADAQLARRGVRERRVLEAMRRVPREEFVEPGYEEFAYEDSPLPIGEGQTISQPYIVALMIEAGEVRPGDAVLEVGAGSGYVAAGGPNVPETLKAQLAIGGRLVAPVGREKGSQTLFKLPRRTETEFATED